MYLSRLSHPRVFFVWTQWSPIIYVLSTRCSIPLFSSPFWDFFFTIFYLLFTLCALPFPFLEECKFCKIGHACSFPYFFTWHSVTGIWSFSFYLFLCCSYFSFILVQNKACNKDSWRVTEQHIRSMTSNHLSPSGGSTDLVRWPSSGQLVSGLYWICVAYWRIENLQMYWGMRVTIIVVLELQPSFSGNRVFLFFSLNH